MRWFHGLAIAFVASVLVGCATVPSEPGDVLVLKQREGRFSVQTQAPNEADQAVQGSFAWRRLTSGWQLDLKSPLGATLARLTVSAGGATLEQPDAPARRAQSGQELLASVLGASVPLNVFEDWMDGRLVDDSKVTRIERDAQNRIVSFVESGWQVKFDRYGDSGPTRVSVQGTQAGRSVILRLVLEQPV